VRAAHETGKGQYWFYKRGAPPVNYWLLKNWRVVRRTRANAFLGCKALRIYGLAQGGPPDEPCSILDMAGRSAVGLGGAAMSIEIKPETERLIQEEIQKGHFHSVDEIIIEGVHARREKLPTKPTRAPKGTTLSEFLLNSPLAGSELNLERDKDQGRTIEL